MRYEEYQEKSFFFGGDQKESYFCSGERINSLKMENKNAIIIISIQPLIKYILIKEIVRRI